MTRFRRPNRQLIVIMLVLVGGLAAWWFWHQRPDKTGLTGTITATPTSSGRLGAGYTVSGKNGSLYQIYAMYGGPVGYGGKLDCVKLPEDLKIGDKVRFNLPANPSLTSPGVQGYAICYPAGQNQNYYLREI